MSESKAIIEMGRVIYIKPLAADDVSVVADVDINDHAGYDHATEATGGALTLAAIATRHATPRNVIITITDADSSIASGGNVTVFGINANGESTKEVFTIGAGTATYTGNVAFAQITGAVVWGFTAAEVTETDDNIKIGGGNKLGLPMGPDCVLLDVIKDLHAGANIAVVPANVNRTYGTYTGTNATGAADHDIELWYTFKRLLNW
jgi:hypothetical protein